VGNLDGRADDETGDDQLDGLAVAEELVVRVVAAVTAADLRAVGHEFDPGQPFDLLEAELDLVAQPQRRAAPVGQRAPFIS
jgi:hypothetical protein